jgi:MFS family permease
MSIGGIVGSLWRRLRATISVELVGRQERFLAVSLSILYLGTGLSYSLLALYLVRYLHVSPASYGLGTSVAAFLGIASGPVMGRLADRKNGHRLYATLVWTMCAATAAFIVTGAWLALALLTVLTVCGRGSAAVIGALVGRAVAESRRIRYRALVKSLSNAMMVVGLGLGALVLAVDARWTFQVGFAVEALTFLVAGSLVWLAAPAASTNQPESGGQHEGQADEQARQPRLGALSDLRFVALTALNCLLTLPEAMLTIALPLWVSQRMHAPLWLVSVALVVNTIGIVLLQVPASRGVSDAATATRAGRKGAFLYALAAAMFPLAAIAGDGPVAIGEIVVLALARVGGEVFYSAGSWGLVYGLAPEESIGQYQGVFNTGFDVSMMVGPALFAWLVGVQSPLGWAVLAGIFAIAALLLGPLSASGRGRGSPNRETAAATGTVPAVPQAANATVPAAE